MAKGEIKRVHHEDGTITIKVPKNRLDKIKAGRDELADVAEMLGSDDDKYLAREVVCGVGAIIGHIETGFPLMGPAEHDEEATQAVVEDSGPLLPHRHHRYDEKDD